MKHLAEDTLWGFITDDLVARDRVMVESHLKECPDCMQEYLSAKALHEGLFELDPEQPSLAFAKNVLTKIEYEANLEKSRNFWFSFTKALIIGAMVLAIASVFVLLDAQKDSFVLDENALSMSVQILLGICLLWAFYGVDRLLKAYLPIASTRL